MSLLDLIAAPAYVPPVGVGRVHRMRLENEPPDDWWYCKGCDADLPPTEFYYDVRSSCYRTVCKKCATSATLARRKERKGNP